MKPGEDMHSAVEEVDVDPSDLYSALGSLIVEGRIPGLTERGFGEGPHCPPAASAIGAPQSRHQCNPEVPECQRFEHMQKHMLLLWKNSIPMSIEVLLYPSCCSMSTPFQNVDTSSIPDMSYIMIEQWTVHMLPRRVADASISPRGLMQAIRSFLYFSQLCAWLSLSGGKSPQNVHYRVCVPGEAFSSKFSSTPDCHVFPIANIGRNAAMKVLVKSHPRCGEIPRVLCHEHSPSLPLKAVKQDTKCNTENETEEPLLGAEGEVLDGILPLEAQNPRTSSPADSMLGESLLDPPNSLCMYPKRYQSPSRCGSPSLEVPEHLMFGKAGTSQETQRQRVSSEMQNRSRPHQRPVFQRVLEKKLSDGLLSSMSSSSSSSSSSPSSSLSHKENDHIPLDLLQSLHLNDIRDNIDLANYLCLNKDFKEVPPEEMESVLYKLRNNHYSRSPFNANHHPSVFNSSERLKPPSQQAQSTCNPLKLPFHFNKAGQPIYSYKPSYHIQKSLLNHNPSIGKQPKKTAAADQKSGDQHSKSYHLPSSVSGQLAAREMKREIARKNITLSSQKTVSDIGSSSIHPYYNTHTYHHPESHIPQTIPPNFSGVNIKKCGALLQSLTLKEKLIDERDIANSSEDLQMTVNSILPDILPEDFDYGSHSIPSAEEKAQFRRSLDSATSLVFHKKSGLPLTSSPAPIRKSGTCFDFDSSLTSVSAIKRALFEKQPEREEIQTLDSQTFSLSAPSSMTVSSLLGTFEESVLNGRLEPVSTVQGFTAEIGASGSFCPRHITLPVTIFFYTLQDIDKVTSPYLGHINLGNKDYHIPKRGTVQVTLFNPHRTVVKMFVVRYDLNDMPPNCQTFLRQRTLYMPSDESHDSEDAQKWLRYLIHLRFASSKSGRIYLHTDIRMIIFRKSDVDAATVHGQRPYELRSFTQGPINPKFSPHKT